ncbi:MAG: NAD(P)H-binding protein [Desulfoprunum sp.]|uniref:NAD(P)H-binding protein n=1 Tax=Desulfoprunum sp. TaxID=2020866 RepID=UPI000691737A
MTDPTPKTVLITGATGYIGRRLTHRLLDAGDCRVRLLVRNRNKVQVAIAGRVDVREGSTFDAASLAAALDGVDCAFYLIHSMGEGEDYRRLDRESAENFRRACIAAGVRRIVYLGGLGRKESASTHLLSRIETGEVLSAEPDKIQTIWLRAGVIIGFGSASFEIIRNLAQKLPLLIPPGGSAPERSRSRSPTCCPTSSIPPTWRLPAIWWSTSAGRPSASRT